MPLKTHYHISSVKGLSSVTTLLTGPTSSILIDPPFLLPDAESVIAWIKATAPSTRLAAVFATHHHPDHYFSATPILRAFPSARFLAAPYVCAGIEREYDAKVAYWPQALGAHNFAPEPPAKPAPYPFSFVSVDGEAVFLVGPVQGDAVDHTLFWAPESDEGGTLVAGDVVYARSTHVWAEEIETPAIHAAWLTTLDLIEHTLRPATLIPGHIERGWAPDAAADVAHTRAYLQLFDEKILQHQAVAAEKPSVAAVYGTFRDAFPAATENLEFFLGHLANRFGEGGDVWEENRHQPLAARTREELEGWRV